MSKASVLVVEDNPLSRATAVSMFEALGFAVFDAYSGHHALALLEARPEIGVLFVDVRMPGMSGPELAEIVRRRRPDIRIVLTSGYVGEEAVPTGFSSCPSRGAWSRSPSWSVRHDADPPGGQDPDRPNIALKDRERAGSTKLVSLLVMAERVFPKASAADITEAVAALQLKVEDVAEKAGVHSTGRQRLRRPSGELRQAQPDAEPGASTYVGGGRRFWHENGRTRRSVDALARCPCRPGGSAESPRRMHQVRTGGRRRGATSPVDTGSRARSPAVPWASTSAVRTSGKRESGPQTATEPRSVLARTAGAHEPVRGTWSRSAHDPSPSPERVNPYEDLGFDFERRRPGGRDQQAQRREQRPPGRAGEGFEPGGSFLTR
jgi:CheY-like chemotaxis protein